jgi:hypothetical protein
MKHWINKNYKTLIIAAFLIPIMTVAVVSISHVTKWYGISNPVSWSIYLSIGIEIAALSALAAISADMGKKVYFPFAVVTLVQFIGNIFFAYSYIDINSQSFKDWVDLVSPLVSFMGVESTDFVGHKRFLAFFAGGMLPIISLSFLHMLVKFTEEDRKKEEVIIEEEKKHVIDEELIKEAIENYKKEQELNKIEASDLVGETSRLRLSEEDLKKLEEVLLNPPLPNEKLKEAAKRYSEEVKEKHVHINDFEVEVKAVEQPQPPKEIEEEIIVDDELSNIKEEIINDTPISIEEKKLELKQVVFEPIPEVQPEVYPALSDEEVKEMFMDEWERKFDMVEEEEISIIEPTEEEESQNFSTIEPPSENIFQNEEDGWTEELEQQFWDEQVPEPFATPEEIELQTNVTATPVVPNEEVEKKNS